LTAARYQTYRYNMITQPADFNVAVEAERAARPTTIAYRVLNIIHPYMATRLSRGVNASGPLAQEQIMNISARRRAPSIGAPMSWTDARIAQLVRLWAEGVSAGGIAEILGDVSRSAVLGKLHRMKLLGSRAEASAPRRYDGPVMGASRRAPIAAVIPSAAAPPDPPRSPWREAAFEPLPGVAPRPWLMRAVGECAFPVGGESDAALSCCAPTTRRSAYCAAHHRIVFRPAPRSGLGAAESPVAAAAADRWAA
jgi:GcrA cell cycle regulator